MNRTFLPIFLLSSLFLNGCFVFGTDYVTTPFNFPSPNSSLGTIDTVWQIYTLKGDSIEFSALRGKKVFANFWASWCAPCVAEMPHLQALYNAKRNDPSIVFLFLSIEDKETVQSFILKHEYTFPVYISKQAPRMLQISFIPSTFLFNSRGELAYKKIGYSDWSDSSVVRFLDSLP